MQPCNLFVASMHWLPFFQLTQQMPKLDFRKRTTISSAEKEMWNLLLTHFLFFGLRTKLPTAASLHPHEAVLLPGL